MSWIVHVYANPLINPSILKSDRMLKEDEAFKFTAAILNTGFLNLEWIMAKNIYLYKNKISIKSPNNIFFKDLPKGKMKSDNYFGYTEVYYKKLSTLVKFDPKSSLNILINYQGCSEMGFCYPLIKKEITVTNGNLNIKKITNSS